MEPFEELGTWWLPGRENDERGGTLRFAYGNDSLTLSLTGSFSPRTVDPTSAPLASYPIVFGRTSSGRLVTLEDASATHTQFIGFEGEVLNEQISCAQIFIGALLADGSNSLTRRISMNFEHLSDWALPGGSFAKIEPGESHDGARFERLEFSTPAPVVFDALGASIAISYGFEQSLGVHEFSAKRPVQIIATFPDPVPFDETYEQIVKPLQYFLTLACSAPTQLLELELTIDEHDQVLNNEVTVPTWIKSAHRGWHAPKDVSVPYFEMLLPLRSCKERLAETLLNWTDIMERGANALDLLTSLSLGPPLYLETRFLLSVQAIEAYARRRFDNTSVTPEAHEKRKALVMEALPDDDDLRKWVKGLLHWSNEPTLAERLEHIVTYCTPPAQELLRNNFVRLTKDTRNWLTHYSEDLRLKAASGEDLYRLTEEVIVLMECLLLRDLGFDGEEVGNLLRSTRRAQSVFRTNQYRDEP